MSGKFIAEFPVKMYYSTPEIFSIIQYIIDFFWLSDSVRYYILVDIISI